MASLRHRVGSVVAVLAAFVCVTCEAQGLTAAAERGKQIYTRGESVTGTPISALVARSTTPLPAMLLPCVGCHGQDGKGRPEGGVSPSDIRWATLSTPFGHRHEYGRAHAAFDEESLKRAVLTGNDPAGNALDPAMPRFDMSESDFDDLIAYLKAIDQDRDPGISDDAVRVGTLIPLEGPLVAAGDAIKKTLDAYFADINAAGGVHGRRLELVAGDYAMDPVQAEWNVRDLVATKDVFALVGGYVTGLEEPIIKLATEKKLPIVGPFTLAPPGDAGRHTFFLLGGIVEQSRALVEWAFAQPRHGAGMAVVHATGEVYESAAARANEQLGDRGAVVLNLGFDSDRFDVAAAAKAVRDSAATAVLFLGPVNALTRFAAELELTLSTPDLLLPGVFAQKGMFDISSSYGGRVLVGYSSMPSDHTPKGVAAFETLHRNHGLDYENSTLQIAAFVAAEVLVEGLKRAGRDLSRERLVAELEDLSDFDSGLMPPLRYNGVRRIGALGAYVVGLDLTRKTFATNAEWIDLKE